MSQNFKKQKKTLRNHENNPSAFISRLKWSSLLNANLEKHLKKMPKYFLLFSVGVFGFESLESAGITPRYDCKNSAYYPTEGVFFHFFFQKK